MYENAVAGVRVGGEEVGLGELVEAARGEGEFGVEVKRGGGEATEGERELSGEEELEAELGFAAAAL